eukprot:3460918-Prymnesium_polylepis.2
MNVYVCVRAFASLSCADRMGEVLLLGRTDRRQEARIRSAAARMFDQWIDDRAHNSIGLSVAIACATAVRHSGAVDQP